MYLPFNMYVLCFETLKLYLPFNMYVLCLKLWNCIYHSICMFYVLIVLCPSFYVTVALSNFGMFQVASQCI
jgi:hypothetical protein